MKEDLNEKKCKCFWRSAVGLIEARPSLDQCTSTPAALLLSREVLSRSLFFLNPLRSSSCLVSIIRSGMSAFVKREVLTLRQVVILDLDDIRTVRQAG